MSMTPFGEDEIANRATCKSGNIHYCEPGNPWIKGSGRAYHPHASEVADSQEDGWPSGDTVLNRCPVCGHSWRQELPQ